MRITPFSIAAVVAVIITLVVAINIKRSTDDKQALELQRIRNQTLQQNDTRWVVYLAVLLQLRRVFASLTSGQPFLRANVRNFRVIGWLVIADFLIDHASDWALVLAMRSTLTLAGKTPNVPIEFVIEDLGLGRLFVGATVLVLAEIFRIGAGLQEEQSLTV